MSLRAEERYYRAICDFVYLGGERAAIRGARIYAAVSVEFCSAITREFAKCVEMSRRFASRTPLHSRSIPKQDRMFVSSYRLDPS